MRAVVVLSEEVVFRCTGVAGRVHMARRSAAAMAPQSYRLYLHHPLSECTGWRVVDCPEVGKEGNEVVGVVAHGRWCCHGAPHAAGLYVQ